MTVPTITSQSPRPYQELADRIVAGGDNYYKKIIKQICLQETFYSDPIAYLVHEMIIRGVVMCRVDDVPRAIVAREVPRFFSTACSVPYLKKFAIQYFKDDPNSQEILKVFEQSSRSDNFTQDLQLALKEHSEFRLRVALRIFDLSAILKEYTTIGEFPQ